jgi:hypothetical protein
MKKAYIVSQGNSDSELFKKLFPKNIVNETVFTDTPTRSSAISLACSILAVKQLPVGLVVDAKTNEESSLEDQTLALEEILRYASPGISFDVFLAIPEIEILFLQDKMFLEKLAQKEFSDSEWEQGKLNPKEFLRSVLNQEERRISETILNQLDEQTVHSMQSHPLVNDLCRFLSSAVNDTLNS